MRPAFWYSAKKRRHTGRYGVFSSDSYRIQTCNLLIRSQMLYSVELRSRSKNYYYYEISLNCDSYRIQTCNLLIRSQMLYSVELRSRWLLPYCECKVTTKSFIWQML